VLLNVCNNYSESVMYFKVISHTTTKWRCIPKSLQVQRRNGVVFQSQFKYNGEMALYSKANSSTTAKWRCTPRPIQVQRRNGVVLQDQFKYNGEMALYSNPHLINVILYPIFR